MLNEENKSKVINLFQFLKQYNNIKNPTITDIASQHWHRWLNDIPNHEKIKNNIYKEDDESDELLTVGKPEFTECPEPPVELREWLEKGWNKFEGEVKVKEYINKIEKYRETEDENSVKVNFDDDNKRVIALEKWKSKRNIWLEKEKISHYVDDIFNMLYTVYSTLKKESETMELIIGDGILGCSAEKKIYHPVIIQKVNLIFDSNVPEFRIEVSDKSPELYKNIFNLVPDSNTELLLEIYKEFEKEEFSPFDINSSNSFLNRVANALSPKGKFLKNEEGFRFQEYPQIFRKPVLFIRRINMGFESAIDTILEDLDEIESIPVFLKDIIGVDEDNNIKNINKKIVEENSTLLSSNGLDENILLTKPANTDQLAVAKHLERQGAVLVQGPPGTGKTHTIANMIGHLLSQGKNILVTSYSEKALSVLKEKVTDNLQALCLSLLSTTESRIEMEKTLDVINENRSRLELNSLNQRIISLERDRKYKIEKLGHLKLELKNARLNEYRAIVIGGKEFKPKECAKFINTHKENASWIPLPIKKGMNLSLTYQELEELYLSNEAISEEEENEFNNNLPDISELITPIEFNNLINKKNSFKKEVLNYGIEFWKDTCKVDEENLKEVINKVENSIKNIDLNNEWTLEIIENSKEDVLKQNWIDLKNEINRVYKIALECSQDILNYNPEFKNLDDNIDVKAILDEIIKKLESGGKIRKINLLLNKQMKLFINSCRVNGHIPVKSKEYKALDKFYTLKLEREKLKNRWNRQMVPLGADSTEVMGDNFESICIKYTPIINENISWYNDIWARVEEDIKEVGLDLDKINNRVDLSSDRYGNLKYIKTELSKKVIELIQSQISRIKYKQIRQSKEKIENIINKYSSNKNSKIISNLQNAMINEDANLYKECYEAILDIKNIGKNIIRRRELIDKLEKTAPKWANEIRLRNGKFGEGNIPLNINDAWKYAQFKQEIDYRNSVNIEEIQTDILDMEKALRKNTSELAFNKAWLYKLKSFENNKTQVRAIEGWRQLIRKIGQGKGKKAEKLKSEARKLMPECQGAVPVWIMPLNKVVENFNPKKNKFDVVIIDEASQADVMAIVALYLGKQVIIVGDNEQVSPLAIGEKTEDVENLAKEYLDNIPHKSLYNGKFSIYDLAQASGYQPVRLKEHFRCVPEIIQYSNILSYNGQIKALRETSQIKTKPAIVTYRVLDGIISNKINEKEIDAVVSLILACCEQKEYKGKSFGVITLKGDKQATFIDRKLQSKMDVKEYNNRNILCGNASNFQGDERDIIFLTMVDVNDNEGPMRLQSFGSDDLFKKRYNVAVSRAKDQLWLIHSLDYENDLKQGDIRKGLLEYCNNYKSRQVEFEKSVIKAESEFEKRVIKYLIDRGYNVTPQWEVGAFRIDMVVSYKGNKIAIECDGEKWHGEDKLEEDMNRQSILERLGWRFIRIRGSEFFTDEVASMKMVIKKLNELEIYPEEYNCESKDDNILKNTVISRAQEIRASWKIEEDENN
ncbi:AAA domain-containing protein [Clostridium perfringens]|uniref:AAA domain-containing protein n=1 Tax=Clostridium perfringens TaxID=1502 RepID=UPI000BBB4750|nr:AAA domain-containing protein [Clostridium perfringens]